MIAIRCQQAVSKGQGIAEVGLDDKVHLSQVVGLPEYAYVWQAIVDKAGVDSFIDLGDHLEHMGFTVGFNQSPLQQTYLSARKVCGLVNNCLIEALIFAWMDIDSLTQYPEAPRAQGVPKVSDVISF